MRLLSLLPGLAAASVVAGCSVQPPQEEAGPAAGSAEPAALLSDYGFFEGELAQLRPAEGVTPYEPVSPLWSDGALKSRFLVLPEGESIDVRDDEEWELPLGSVLIKHFAFARDAREPEGERVHVETRLMTQTEEGWTGEVYLWDEDQAEAERFLPGALLTLDLLDEQGEAAPMHYVVPNTNHCRNCHEREDGMHLLGVIPAQLNTEVERDGELVSQLDWLAEQGLFSQPLPPAAELPALASPTGPAPLEDRARSYLHANCSHCHRPGANAWPSGLFFTYWEDDPIRYGVCKRPVATGAGSGGHSFDIVPGDPESSIVTFRMESTDPDIKMPELSNLQAHAEGVELVWDWIAQMPHQLCE